MAGTMSLLVSGLAYAETEATYPDCVVYDYETGEETIIPAGEFMNVTNARTNDTGEQISPALKWKHFISTFKMHIHKEQSFRYDNSRSKSFVVDGHTGLEMPKITLRKF